VNDPPSPGDALEAAVRALRARDHTAASLDARLEHRGVGEERRLETVARLQELGYVDDARFAHTRADALAARGAGDLLIADDLERHGVSGTLAATAIAALEPERTRAAAIIARRGAGPKTARFLASKGFAEDVAEAAVATPDHEALG
jgi:regulatory protein